MTAMIAQIPPEILSAIPSRWLVWATAGWVLLQSGGRVYHAIASGGGFVTIWHGLLYGTNSPKNLNGGQGQAPAEKPNGQ